MKKIVIACCFAAFSFAASAQTAAAPAAVSKEEKERMREQQEQDLVAAMKAADLSDVQMVKVRAVLDAAGKASKDLAANATLTDDQKKEAKAKITDDKNTKLKEIMGAEGYKKWNDARKAQKKRPADTGTQNVAPGSK